MAGQSDLHRKMRIALDSRKERGILRRPHPDAFIPLPPGQSHLQNQTELAPLVDFSSNDYLSLSAHEPLRLHYLGRLQHESQILGSGGSRLLDGTRPAHLELEQRLAMFFSSTASQSWTALLFNSGFDANAALFSALPQPGDTILYDALVHASVHDEQKIQDALQSMGNTGTIFVALEALYSMDGDFAPLSAICSTVEALIPVGRACIVVDEAHSTGIYGGGRGMVQHLGLNERVHIRLHTFGKAMASSGAVVICDALTREYLINYARSFIFTTAPTVANVIAMGCSFDMVENGTTEQLKNQLFKASSRFTTTLRTRLVDIPTRVMALPPHLLPDSKLPDIEETYLPTPIVPIMTPFPRPLAQHLYRRGFLARPITHPTVPKGEERVRICLHAANTEEEVDGLVGALVEWAKEQAKIQSQTKCVALTQKGTVSLPSAKL